MHVNLRQVPSAPSPGSHSQWWLCRYQRIHKLWIQGLLSHSHFFIDRTQKTRAGHHVSAKKERKNELWLLQGLWTLLVHGIYGSVCEFMFFPSLAQIWVCLHVSLWSSSSPGTFLTQSGVAPWCFCSSTAPLSVTALWPLLKLTGKKERSHISWHSWPSVLILCPDYFSAGMKNAVWEQDYFYTVDHFSLMVVPVPPSIGSLNR